MMMLLVTAVCVLVLLLVLVSSVTPHRSRLSLYQLQKQTKLRRKSALLDRRREDLLIDVLSIQRLLTALLVVLLTVLLVATAGWLVGGLFALTAAVLYPAAAQVPGVRRQFQKIYDRNETAILGLIEPRTRYLRLFRSSLPEVDGTGVIQSRDELEQLVRSAAPDALQDEQRAMLLGGLSFHQRRVGEVMTERGSIASISADELLGPLVLDDLHRTGRSLFPVTASGDIDAVVGILDVKNLLSLDVKKSTTAERAMEARVVRIDQQSRLPEALAVLLDQQCQLLLVVDVSGKTVGLISLGDVIEALTGVLSNMKP